MLWQAERKSLGVTSPLLASQYARHLRNTQRDHDSGKMYKQARRMWLPIHIPQPSRMIGRPQSEGWKYRGWPPGYAPYQSMGYRWLPAVRYHVESRAVKKTMFRGTCFHASPWRSESGLTLGEYNPELQDRSTLHDNLACPILA